MLVIYIKCVAVRMDCVFEHVCSFAQQHHYFMFSTLWYLLHQPNIKKHNIDKDTIFVEAINFMFFSLPPSFYFL